MFCHNKLLHDVATKDFNLLKKIKFSSSVDTFHCSYCPLELCNKKPKTKTTVLHHLNCILKGFDWKNKNFVRKQSQIHWCEALKWLPKKISFEFLIRSASWKAEKAIYTARYSPRVTVKKVTCHTEFSISEEFPFLPIQVPDPTPSAYNILWFSHFTAFVLAEIIHRPQS